MVLGEQAGDLADRRHRPRSQHGAGNQAAQRQLAVGNQVHADHDAQHIHELLRPHCAVDGGRRQQPQLGAHARQKGRARFPLALHHAFGPQRLDRFQPDQAFDQGGVAQRAGAVGRLGQFVHLAVHDQRIDHHQQHAEQDGKDHRPGNPADDHQKDQRKRQVDEGGDRRRGDEITDGFEGTQVGGKRARGQRPVFHAQPQHALHDVGGKSHVHPAAGQVEEITPHRAQRHIRHQHDHHAARQHPQRLDGVVGDHAVVHVHGEQRQCDGEQVDHERRQHHIAIEQLVLGQRPPEPVPLLDLADFGGARIEAELGAGENGEAGIAGSQFIARQQGLGLAQFGEDQARGLAVPSPAQQYAGLVVVEQQYRRKEGGIQPVQRLADDIAGEAGALGRAPEQRRGQAVVDQRQAIDGTLAAQRAAVRMHHHEQAFEQGVGRCGSG